MVAGRRAQSRGIRQELGGERHEWVKDRTGDIIQTAPSITKVAVLEA